MTQEGGDRLERHATVDALSGQSVTKLVSSHVSDPRIPRDLGKCFVNLGFSYSHLSGNLSGRMRHPFEFRY